MEHPHVHAPALPGADGARYSTTTIVRRILGSGARTLLMALLCAAGAAGQGTLDITHATVNWPDVDVYFHTERSGNPDFQFDAGDLRVTDDGNEIRNFSLSCPDQTQSCAASYALVFDACESMTGSDNTQAIEAGTRILTYMNWITDEAAVIFFNDSVHVAQSMNNDHMLLLNAVRTLPAVGSGRLLWDGARAGLDALIADGSNPCRALVLLADGTDYGSTNTPQTLLELAVPEQIRIYTIGLGMTTRVEELQLLAARTGGHFYQTNSATSLKYLYGEIANHVAMAFQECHLSYTATCADGAMHEIKLELPETGWGAPSDTLVYAAPHDTSTYSNLVLGMEHRTGYARSELQVPIELRTPLDGSVLAPMFFTVEVDTNCMEVVGVALPAGDLFDSSMVTVTDVSSGVHIATNRGVLAHGTGVLLRLRVRLLDVPDTTCGWLRITQPSFSRGCFHLQPEEGRVCVWPLFAALSCAIDSMPALVWNDRTDSYDPDQLSVIVRLANEGNEPARRVRGRLSADWNLLRLATLTDSMKFAVPWEISPGDTGTVQWQLTPRALATETTTRICIESWADNAPSVVCCHDVVIPPSQQALRARLWHPTLRADSALAAYVPQPLPLTAWLRNDGKAPLRGLTAELQALTKLRLAGPDAPARYRKDLQVPSLQPGDSASVEWQLEVLPPWPTAAVDIALRVLAWADDGDSTEAMLLLRIPPLDLVFSFDLEAGGPLTICHGWIVTLDAGPGRASYLWSTGATTRRIEATTAGEYSCVVTDSAGRRGYSDTLTVVVRPDPEPVITLTGPQPFCPGDSVLLRTTLPYQTYEWSNGRRGEEIVVRDPGEYFVIVIDSAGCSGVSDTMTVLRHDAPGRPVITRVKDVLTSSRATRYQWLRDGEELPGAVNQFLSLPGTGSYTVRIEDANGCSALSVPFQVDILAIDEAPRLPLSLQLYPQPAREAITVTLSGAVAGRLRLTLEDMLGRMVFHREYDIPAKGFSTLLDTSTLPPGTYLLRGRLGSQLLRRMLTIR